MNAQANAKIEDILHERDVDVPMRDGVRPAHIAGDVARPTAKGEPARVIKGEFCFESRSRIDGATLVSDWHATRQVGNLGARLPSSLRSQEVAKGETSMFGNLTPALVDKRSPDRRVWVVERIAGRVDEVVKPTEFCVRVLNFFVHSPIVPLNRVYLSNAC